MNEKAAKYILISIGVAFISFVGYFMYLDTQEFRYSVSTSTRKVENTNGVPSVYFTFKVDGKEYESFVRIDNKAEEKYQVGKQYIVKYSILKPDYAGLMLNFPIQFNSNLEPPLGGWSKNPFEASK